ncbi:MAG: energy-coupling factor ABC transporter ATP-binding protein, partial [Anaerolineae bacterium]
MPVVHQTAVSRQLPSTTQPTLQINNLTFSYPDGFQALRGVSLQIAAGEKVALVGPNGAGKSTLILHLNGIFAGEGDIAVGGLPVVKPNLPQVRAKVGLVFQNPDDQLFSPTVFEDVAFGPLHMGLPESEVYERVNRALAQVGMAEFSQRMPYHMSM